MFNIVFFVVIVSVAIQGTTIPTVARWLNLEGPSFEPRILDRESVDDARLLEYLVPDHSTVIGKQLAQSGLPESARVMLVRRYEQYLVPNGRTRLRQEDVVVMLLDEQAEHLLEQQGQFERVEGVPAVCRWPEMDGSEEAEGATMAEGGTA